MDSLEDWLVVGRFGRPHGIKGFITIRSFTEPYENILHYKDWHIWQNQQWQPIVPLNTMQHHGTIIALIQDYEDREAVTHLTNAEIAIKKHQLAQLEPGEFYWFQLIGMKVINLQGLTLGTVIEIMPTGANDVLIVKGEKRHLIPYRLEQFIISIDAEQQLITVDWDINFL